MAQNYKNHLRFNPLHHFILVPLSLFLFITAFVRFINTDRFIDSMEFLMVIAGFCLILVTFVARLYALKLQDRLIRLEMRQRYFELTGKSFMPLEKQLSLGQIIALRFCSNEELIPLMEKAIADSLSNKQIKQAIKDWQADTMRC